MKKGKSRKNGKVQVLLSIKMHIATQIQQIRELFNLGRKAKRGSEEPHRVRPLNR